MNINTRVRAILSIILSIIAVILIYSYLSSSKNTVTIVVAGDNIEKGVILSESMLTEKSILEDVRDTYFQNCVETIEEIAGAVTKEKLKKGEPIFTDQETLAMGDELLYAISKDGIVNDSYFIPDNCRLVSIEVDNSGSINYSIKEGDYVDVIFSSIDESTGGLYTSMLLQHIEVYEVEEIVSDDGGVIAKRQNITLIATPQQCLSLVSGNRNGLLDLALNPTASQASVVNTVSILDYSVQREPTREEIINGLRNHINALDLRESVKEEMQEKLDSEQSIEALLDYIDSINMDAEMKVDLLNIIDWEEVNE
jgi:Flp pilus assembly protein CpaB